MFGGGCATRLERRAGPELGSVDPGARFLKLHLYSGEAYVLRFADRGRHAYRRGRFDSWA